MYLSRDRNVLQKRTVFSGTWKGNIYLTPCDIPDIKFHRKFGKVTYLHTCCHYICILTGCMNSRTSLGCWYSRHWRGSHVNHWSIHSCLGIKKSVWEKVFILVSLVWIVQKFKNVKNLLPTMRESGPTSATWGPCWCTELWRKESGDIVIRAFLLSVRFLDLQ